MRGVGKSFVDIDAEKSNTVALSQPVKRIWVGSIAGGAAVKVKLADGSVATLAGCIAGTEIDKLDIVQVYDTGTTASSLIGIVQD